MSEPPTRTPRRPGGRLAVKAGEVIKGDHHTVTGLTDGRVQIDIAPGTPANDISGILMLYAPIGSSLADGVRLVYDPPR